MKTGTKAGVGSLLVVLLAAPFVARHEGVILRPYLDPVGIKTACAGETDEAVTLRDSFSRDECIALLGASLLTHAQQLDKCIARPVKDNEAAALLSWSYNVGVGAACGSTLVKLLNAGQPASVWCAQLSRWTYAGGKQLPGLVTRRAEERALCEGK